MTCIVGLVDKGKVYIGGDSAGVAGYSIQVRADQKVFVNGAFVFGFSGSFRMGQLLHYKFNPPRRHPDDDMMGFLVTDFVDGLRRCFKDGGFAEKNNEVEIGGFFLLGHAGRLFTIESDYQVGERTCGYAAVGCGDDLALGSLHSTAALKISPKKRVLMALEAAAEHSAGVVAPFLVESTN